jgi:hypothetical protein
MATANSSFGWLVAGADLLWEKNTVGWLMADSWCWINIREKYCWLARRQLAEQGERLGPGKVAWWLPASQYKLGGGLDAAAGLGLNSAILNTTDKVLKQLLKDCTDQKKKYWMILRYTECYWNILWY